MHSIPYLAETLYQVFGRQAEAIAQTVGMDQRQRQIRGAQLLQVVVASVLAHPDLTYETMVGVAADQGITISPQGLAARCDARAVAGVAALLQVVAQQVVMADPVVAPLLDRFAAVEIHDSTTIALPACLADQYQGCGGNGQGGRVAAAVKAQVRWDLRSGRIEGPIFQDGRAADRAVEFAQRSAPGTLRIRDRGYWHLDDILQDLQDGRWWLTRLKPQTALFTTDGHRIDLPTLLTDQTTEAGEFAVCMGVKQRVPARLIVRTVSADVQAARQARLIHTARRKGRTVSASALALAAWDILITTAPPDRLPMDAAGVLYAARWQIEWLFKLWKQEARLDESRGIQPARVLIELYAKWIAVVIQHWIIVTSWWDEPRRSLVKAAKVVRAWAERLFRAITDRERLEAILGDLCAAIRRTHKQTRRKAKPTTWDGLTASTTA